MSDLQSDLRRLHEIRQRFEAAKIRVRPIDEHRDGVECPLCHGDGDVESNLRDTEKEDGCSYVGIQTFGAGDKLKATNEFVTHLADDMAWLLAALAPAVKPLAWKRQSLHWWQAETPFGPYGVKQVDECDYRTHLIGGDIETHPTLEAAQAAAWAHWCERIGGAIQ